MSLATPRHYRVSDDAGIGACPSGPFHGSCGGTLGPTPGELGFTSPVAGAPALVVGACPSETLEASKATTRGAAPVGAGLAAAASGVG